MNAPHPTFVPSRLNVGGYGVEVRRPVGVFEYESDHKTLKVQPTFVYWLKAKEGTVTPDGVLSVELDSWVPRHYRRAVMRGAGVYQIGLWAYVAGQRQIQSIKSAQSHLIKDINVVSQREKCTEEVWGRYK